MRPLVRFSLVLGLLVHAEVFGQVERSPGDDPAPDFSGTYVGVRDFVRPSTYPLTAEGQRLLAAHDPYAGDPREFDCLEEPMPQLILWGHAVIQITHEEDAVLMKVERGATIRTIHMGVGEPLGDQPSTAKGYSLGRWIGEVLSVETTHLLGGVLSAVQGHPVSSEARFTERYWRNPGESSLQMELVVHDSVNYTQPVTFEREWRLSPEEQVQDYDCFSLELDESGPVDIDDLRRRLEQQ